MNNDDHPRPESETAEALAAAQPTLGQPTMEQQSPTMQYAVGQAAAPQQYAPAQPSWFGIQLMRQLGPATMIAGIAYLAALFVASLSTIATVIGMQVEDFDAAFLFTVPPQLVGLAVGGVFTLSAEGQAETLEFSVSISLLWVPVLVTAALIGALAAGSSMHERRSPTTVGARWLSSGITGLTLMLAILIFAAMLRPGTTVSGAELSGSSASVSLAFGALLVGVLVPFLSRTLVARRAIRQGVVSPNALAFKTTIEVAAAYVLVGALVSGIAFAVGMAANTGEPLSALTALGWGPTAGLAGSALMHLSSFTMSGSADKIFADILGSPAIGNLPGGSSRGSKSAYWLPGSAPLWLTITAVILTIALILIAGMLVRLRRPASAPSGMSWLITIGTFSAMGVIVTLLGGFSAWTKFEMSGFGSPTSEKGSLLMGPAVWTFLLFAIAGLAVELVARFLAPAFVGVLSPRVQAAIAGFGRSGTIVAQPGMAQPGMSKPAAPQMVDSQPLGHPSAAFPPGQPAQPQAAAGIAYDAVADQSGQTSAFASMTLPQPPSAEMPGTTAPVFGAAVASGAPGQAAPFAGTPAQPAPMSPERKKKIVLGTVIGGGALLLVAIAAVAMSIVNDQVYSPAQQVRSYLDRIVAGDASDAIDIADPNLANSDRVLLTDDVLGKTEQRISGYRIIDVTARDGHAVVQAEIDQDGKKYSMSYTLSNEGKNLLFFDNWRVESPELPVLTVDVPKTVEKMVVNGTTVDLSKIARDDFGNVSLPAFPGSYTVALPKSDEWFTGEAKPALVTPQHLASEGVSMDGPSTTLKITPSDALIAEVDKQAGAVIDECLKSTSLTPKGCPFSAYGYDSDYSGVTWTLDSAPTLDIACDDDGCFFITDEYGEVTVKYTSNNRYYGGPKSATETFSVRGTITFKKGKPVVTINDDW